MPKKTIWEEYLSPSWDWLTSSYLPEADRTTSLNRVYNDVVRPFGSPLGIASVLPIGGALGRAAKYINKGTKLPGGVPAVRNLATKVTGSIPQTLRDEAKQIALTFGVPGTGISSHAIGLAAANLKGTIAAGKLSDLPKEAYETARMLWNPERAVKLNDALTGGLDIMGERANIARGIKQQFPHVNTRSVAFQQAVESQLDLLAHSPQYRNTRLGDVIKLERPTSFQGGGLKTSAQLGGTSAGQNVKRQILTKPVVIGGRNINPISIQKELFDEPLFGNKGINTYFKRNLALKELDRQRANPALAYRNAFHAGNVDQLKKASEFATNLMGGFGADSPSVFNNEIAKWLVTAPDWTRRHFTLANKELQSFGVDLPKMFQKSGTSGVPVNRNPFVLKNLTNPDLAPYRRYAGASAAGLGLTGAANYVLNNQMPTRAGDVFNIELPKNSDYSTRDVLTPSGTEMDLPKTVFDIANAMGGQLYAPDTKDYGAIFDPIRFRMHPAARTLADSIYYNQDWKGDPLHGEERYSVPKRDLFGSITRERPDISIPEATRRHLVDLLGNVTPQTADTIYSMYHGNPSKVPGKHRLSPLARAAQLFELPVRAYTPRYSQVESPLDRRFKRIFR